MPDCQGACNVVPARKVQILEVTEVDYQKAFVLRMIQGRNPDWWPVRFFAEYDDKADWYSSFKPAFGEKEFFFKIELDLMLKGDADVEADSLVLL
jgi:hypothetical protein